MRPSDGKTNSSLGSVLADMAGSAAEDAEDVEETESVAETALFSTEADVPGAAPGSSGSSPQETRNAIKKADTATKLAVTEQIFGKRLLRIMTPRFYGSTGFLSG